MRPSTDLLIPFDPSTCSTLVDILSKRAVCQSDQLAYTFLLNGEKEKKHLTYAELDSQARAIAALLQKNCSSGERALLLYPPGLEYIAAFFGCLYAGIVAAPVYPPSNNRSLDRIRTIAADAEAKVVLTTGQMMPKLQSRAALAALEGLRCLATDAILDESGGWQAPHLRRDMPCFLQYTSGSTGSPRGVVISHGNLMHNSAMLCERCQHTMRSVQVSWLPFFHDMGLIAGILQPLYVGYPVILMAPTAFLQRPMRWLEAMSQYKATTSFAPNFAYDLCVQRVTPEERAALDLSNWKVAVNGAEPVRSGTLERFLQTFGPCGFSFEAFCPGYGLAEGTLMVACSAYGVQPTIVALDKDLLEQQRVQLIDKQAKNAYSLVGCGPVGLNQEVVIAHTETRRRCQPGEIGEIWVAGPSVAQGYWKRAEETKEVFQAYLADTGEGPYLRTGDLGFISAGEVFVTGRYKDLVIIRGRNYYPQDIELTVERSHSSLRAGYGAAFSVVEDNKERLVVVQEVERHFEEPRPAIQAIRQAIAEEYEIRADTVVLVRYASIPKTSSGKIQRRACREAFLKDELLVIASDHLAEASLVEDRTGREQQTFWRQLEEVTQKQKRALLLELVIEQIRAVFPALPEQPIPPECNLLSLGMDSLIGTQLVNRLEKVLGRSLPDVLPFVMREPTVNKLVDYLAITLFTAELPTSRSEPVLKTLLDDIATLTDDEVEAQLMEQLAVADNEASRKVEVLTSKEGEMARTGELSGRSGHKPMQFSLLYFASHDAGYAENKYELLLEGAKFADQHEFTAIWIPERHFHPFGGLYPNPSLLASALAMITRKVRLRAGSVVLPLHHPLRIAEEWAVVDNLSAGRVDLAFATGWNPNDFVLAPTRYEKRKEVLFSGIETFQKLWRGQAVTLPNGLNREASVRIYPLPRQPELTPWITCTGTPERFIEAGILGANVLTGLLFQSQEELAEKIQAYRAARARHGHDPETGHVTLMLHTFLGEEMEEVRQIVRPPFIEYLRSSVDLWRNELKKLDALAPQEQEQVLSYAFERYFQTHGLFGTPQTCQKMVNHLREIGVDEIACLIDFGIDVDIVIDGLYSLSVLQKRCQRNIHVK